MTDTARRVISREKTGIPRDDVRIGKPCSQLAGLKIDFRSVIIRNLWACLDTRSTTGKMAPVLGRISPLNCTGNNKSSLANMIPFKA